MPSSFTEDIPAQDHHTVLYRPGTSEDPEDGGNANERDGLPIIFHPLTLLLQSDTIVAIVVETNMPKSVNSNTALPAH